MSAGFLLTMGTYYGTVAAARCLGRAGIDVTVADDELLSPASWSRYTRRRLKCPPVGKAEQFVDWLLELGAKSPGQVLYPPSDDLAWLFALRRHELGKHFRLYQPSDETVYALLNKKRLFEAGRQVGLAAPSTVFPEDEADIERLAPGLPYPILIKPQTQIFFETHVKGTRVDGPVELRERYREFIQKNRYGQTLRDKDEGVTRPMLQAFHAEAAQNIYSLSGFIDEGGEHFAMRAARKVLQRPRRIGVGLCFEDAPVDEALASKLVALCRKVGYFGVFEVEFIVRSGEALLIDFNPRFYGQMGFEIARGLPLPLLVYLGATGDQAALQRELERARSSSGDAARAYCHRATFELILRAQRLSGAMTGEEVRHWRSWLAERREAITDAVADKADPLPAMVDLASLLKQYVRHPRAFIRHMVLDK